MKKETNGGDATEDVKDTLPSLEDILTPAGWDARIAKARARREKALVDDGKPKAAAKKRSKTKKTSAKSKDHTPAKVSPAIKDILETADWTERLAKAKAHRDQVFAERAQSGEAPAAPLPGKMPLLYKDTIRVAVSGEQAESEPQKTREKKIGAAAFPQIAPVVTEPRRRMGAVYVAAGILLALGIGWIAPSPFRDSTTVADLGEPAVGGATAVEETTVAEAAPGARALPAPQAAPQAAAVLLAQPVVDDSVGVNLRFELATNLSAATNAPAVLVGGEPRRIVVAALSVPDTEMVPVIRTEPFVTTREVAVVNPAETNTPATPVLEIAPEFQVTMATLPQVENGADVIEIAMRQPVSNSPVRATPAAPGADAPGMVASRIKPLPAALDVAAAYSDVVLLTASIEASSSAFQGGFISPADAGSILLRTKADPGIRPTNIRFLSGPVIAEVPVILPLPVTQLAVLAGPRDFVLSGATGIPAAPDVAMPERITEPVRLASIGAIPLSALQQEPTIAAEPPESFESMSTRLASLAPEVVEQTPGFPGADAFTIHLHAPTSLAENKLGAFASALRDTGFSVNEPKRVNFTIRKNNVRYFHSGDEAAARVLATAVGAKARDFTSYSPSPPVGTIEVWLAGETPPASSRRPTKRPSGQDPALTELRNRLLLSLKRGDHL